MSNCILSVNNLSYKKIINGISFNISEGDFICISGPNNSGKTTLIKLLCGLISTDKMIKYKDNYLEDINKTKLFSNEGIVILNENIDFIFNTVKEEILFVLNNLNISSDLRLERYNEVVKLLKIEKFENVDPNTLNRNNKVLLLLALALVHHPKILYLDDITSMMNKNDREEIIKILDYLNKKRKITIVMSTMDLEESLFTDYLYILNDGNISLQGRPLDILKDDNVINRIGLNVPFMVDLSVKLYDYGLVSEIVLDDERMIDLLWK